MSHNNKLDNYVDKVVERLEEFEKRNSQPLFKDLKLIDKNSIYKNECIYCKNTDVFMSSKYVLQRCNTCRKEYVPVIVLQK
jgi:methionyl-tRNA synthetase